MTSFSEDGLLPTLSEQDFAWLKPVESSGDKVQDFLSWVINLMAHNRLVWPAAIDGELVPPPSSHVLDHLVRREFSDTNNAEVHAEFELRPKAGTVALIERLPECHFCEQAGGAGVRARYDGPMSAHVDGPWAFMCSACYDEHSTGRLGNGLGQYLMLSSEIPADVEAALERARAYWSSRIGRH